MEGGFIYEKTNGPLSKGNLTIVNRNASDNPSVTFNYFSEPEDLQKCVKGIETILKTVNSEAFSNYKLANMTTQDILDLNMKIPYNMNAHGNTSTSLEQHCKDTVRTIWHYHGGCNIGKVVDDEYKVLGVDSLRVVDGSTLLNSPGTNPQASLLMLGRYFYFDIQNIENKALSDEFPSTLVSFEKKTSGKYFPTNFPTKHLLTNFRQKY
ncbi:putative glucose-methanol-choline oxidoreductase, FAD/NAD(P)-binding domain superfamily [Helianthus debilis subsp. tardiflorus]